MTSVSRTSSLILMAAMTLAACHRAKPTPGVATPPQNNTATDNSDRGRLERERLERERAERDRLARERADQERALAELRRAMSAPIYFEFDRSDLTDSGRATLEVQAKILSVNPLMRIQIEGNADDLGSDEYNLALGQRRAATAKRYLTDRNIDPARVAVTSFGEERPTCRDETSECRALNRRDDVRITSGEPAMTQR